MSNQYDFHFIAFCSPGYKIDTFTLDYDITRMPSECLNGCEECRDNGKQHCIDHRLKMDSLSFCLLKKRFNCGSFCVQFINKLFKSILKRGIVELDNDNIRVFIRLYDPVRYPMDLNWNHKVDSVIHRYLEVEKLMWWLSTLGGGFSALGDHSSNFAVKAGEISQKQLKLAFWLGDPVLISRCKLFIAISLMQRQRLKMAKRIIRCEYAAAKHYKNQSLINCCLGIWEKLRFYYIQRRYTVI